MSRSFRSNSSFSYKTQRLSMNQQMQRDADQYTRKCEWQSRNLQTLKGVMKGLKKQLESTNQSIKKLKEQCEIGDMKVTFTKMRNLQKQIDIYNKRLNITANETDKVKQEIDVERKQRILSLNNIKQLETEISKLNMDIEKIYENINNEQNLSNISKDQMLELKLENEDNKNRYYKELTELNQKLRQAKQKTVKKEKRDHFDDLITDTATVLKKRLTKIIYNNKEKVRLIDNYQKNMKTIDEAFNTIKEATGLTDIEEIQDTFIKGEEQNYGLLTYVDVLGQEIDNLEDSNKQLEQKVASLRIENADKQRILNATPEEQKRKRKIERVINDKKKEVDDFESFLQEIQPQMLQVLIKCAKSKFNTHNPEAAEEYERNGIILNEASIDEHLAEIEEYTNKILVMVGRQNNESVKDVMSKILMIDELPSKAGKKRVSDNQLTTFKEDMADELLHESNIRLAAIREVQEYQKTVPLEKNKKKQK